jgi:hypothetical protein
MPIAVNSATAVAPAQTEPVAAPAPGFDGLLRTRAAERATVAPVKTPISGTQAASAIRAAYQRVVGETPSGETLAILTSHWSLETARGTRMYNYNFAGIKGTSPEGLSTALATREGHGATAVRIRDGFRAYSSAESGAVDYVSLLERRYAGALDAARAGDPAQFAARLKQKGYYTGDEALYTQGIVRLANRAMAGGLDALGSTEGVLERAPSRDHFRLPAAPALAPGPAQGDFGSGVGADRWMDEVTRVALQIAAQHGAGNT